MWLVSARLLFVPGRITDRFLVLVVFLVFPDAFQIVVRPFVCLIVVVAILSTCADIAELVQLVLQ